MSELWKVGAMSIVHSVAKLHGAVIDYVEVTKVFNSDGKRAIGLKMYLKAPALKAIQGDVAFRIISEIGMDFADAGEEVCFTFCETAEKDAR